MPRQAALLPRSGNILVLQQIESLWHTVGNSFAFAIWSAKIIRESGLPRVDAMVANLTTLCHVDVFLPIAAAIVKAGLKMWLGPGIGTDVGGTTVDILRGKISGDLDRRKAQRFFEDLEVPVARRLQALRENEYASMAENEWTAALIAAGNSFDRARLAARDVLARDLDPLSLERDVRAGSIEVEHLSADGILLYNRVISEGCAYVIEIADKLPRFQSDAFAELLRRDRQMLDLISKVLDRIPGAADGEPAAARFATAYIRHVATKLDRLELFGLDFETPWYPLSVAYVSLRIEASDTEAQLSANTIEYKLSNQPRLAIVGRAGSGKSTVLQWVAVRAARSDFPGSLAAFNDYMPFFLKLREYVGKPLPCPEEFISRNAPMLAAEAPPDWVRTQLRTGRAFVLVDGVDELPASQRGDVEAWLSDLTELFPSARYVITARPSAVVDRWLEEYGFVKVSLEPMPPAVVVEFVQQWYAAARHRQSDEDELSRLSEYETSLRSIIERDRYLRDLADTPLIAGLLCALNRHLRSRLPRRRSEIYSRTLAMFDQRDRVRNIVTAGEPDLAAKTRLLGDIAIWMMRNDESEIDRTFAQDLVARTIPSLHGLTKTSEQIVRNLLERSGVLREPSSGRIDFVHRTFQEYLAAWAAVDGDAIGELLRNAENDQWREVLILAAGQANSPQSTKLIKGLLDGKQVPPRRARKRRRLDLLLAVACLEEVRSLDADVRHTVERRVPDLLPPRSLDDAEQLSKLGEHLIPLLAMHWSNMLSRAPQTIRAASLVGGPAALDLIEAVTQRVLQQTLDGASEGTETTAMEAEAEVKAKEVMAAERAAMRAWQYFEPKEYARRVLFQFGLTNPVVDDFMRAKEALVHLPTLEELYINQFNGVADMSILAKLKNLGALYIAFGDTAVVSGLAQCEQLKLLELASVNNLHSSVIDTPPNLQTLRISAGKIGDLGGIEKFAGIEFLALDGCRNLADLNAATKLFPQLTHITVRDCPKLDLESIAPALAAILVFPPSVGHGQALQAAQRLAGGA